MPDVAGKGQNGHFARLWGPFDPNKPSTPYAKAFTTRVGLRIIRRLIIKTKHMTTRINLSAFVAVAESDFTVLAFDQSPVNKCSVRAEIRIGTRFAHKFSSTQFELVHNSLSYNKPRSGWSERASFQLQITDFQSFLHSTSFPWK